MTDHDFEQQVRANLREALDRELGPDPTWAESPAAQRAAEVAPRRRRRWPLRALAVAALIGATGGAATLLGGGPSEVPPPEALASPLDASEPPPEALASPLELSRMTNGWIAFTVAQDSSSEDDVDIWFAALDQEARRVIGTDTDDVDQLCPAFSPDGRSLAYGRVEGPGTQYSVSADGEESSEPQALVNAALVVADVNDDGTVSDRMTIDIGDGLPPPCPVWSPDGGHVALGVPRTPPVNPEASAAGSEVWVVTLADQSITVLPDLLATDLEWSPDGHHLAIASGIDDPEPAGRLRDGRIHLYALSSGAMRSLDTTVGATELTWSPDGGRIAYTTGDDTHELRVIDVETEQQRAVTPPFGAIHGIGPVWSPDGETIVYQRCSQSTSGACGGERHEVVLVRPGDLSDEGAPQETVIPTFRTTADLSDRSLVPSRVTWSPGGDYLLCIAWGNGDDLLVAVPIDRDMPSIVLAGVDSSGFNGIVSYDGYPDTTLVPIQTWGLGTSE